MQPIMELQHYTSFRVSFWSARKAFPSLEEGASFIAVKALQFRNRADDLFVRTPGGTHLLPFDGRHISPQEVVQQC
jgi:hypothetical protein